MSGTTRDGRRIPDASERPPPAEQPPTPAACAAERELWVVEALDSRAAWRPLPGAALNEHAARNKLQLIVLMAPGVPLEHYRIERYVPAQDGAR